VEGNRLKFDLKVEKPMKITLKYDIAVDGDKLSRQGQDGHLRLGQTDRSESATISV
jgi:hypothetical protein